LTGATGRERKRDYLQTEKSEWSLFTAFLQLEQNSKLHVGHSTERGSKSDVVVLVTVDDEGFRRAADDVEGESFSFVAVGMTEQIVSQFLFGHHKRFLSSSTSVIIRLELG
jgi:endo-beta-N-acetylglucosaminidase D